MHTLQAVLTLVILAAIVNVVLNSQNTPQVVNAAGTQSNNILQTLITPGR